MESEEIENKIKYKAFEVKIFDNGIQREILRRIYNLKYLFFQLFLIQCKQYQV